MTTPSTGSWDRPSRRHSLRYRVQAPVDVTILRSGVPDTVPGRVLDLGAGGVSAVLARELKPGETVAVEIHLDRAQRLRARAQVRHHDRLRCGLEFVGLSAEQQASILRFTRKTLGEQDSSATPRRVSHAETDIANGRSNQGNARPESLHYAGSQGESAEGERPEAAPGKRRRRGWIFLFASIAILLAVLVWRWNRGWEEIESGLHPANLHPEPSAQPEARVSADVMEKLVTHRVDPEYPEAARAYRLQGIVVLDVVIGSDGSVSKIGPVSGPEIFIQPAIEALRWWRFNPYRIEGRAVAIETTVAVEFKP